MQRGDLEGSAEHRKAIADSSLDILTPQVSFSLIQLTYRKLTREHPTALPGLHCQPCQKDHRVTAKGT